MPEEEDIPLSTRVSRANQLFKTNICVLVAVHSNAHGEGRSFTFPRGIESYYYPSSEAGKRIAEVFQENLVQLTGWRARVSCYIDLDSARIFNMNQRYVTASKKSYETVVRNVQLSLIRARHDVLKRAVSNGIREEATRLGEAYFKSLFAGLDYEVEFVSEPYQMEVR